MHKLIRLALVLFAICLIAIITHLFWLNSLNGPERYPEDEFLHQEAEKTALVIVAHDDDAIACSGTLAALSEAGWKIHYLTFYGNWRKEDNPARKEEVRRVAEILSFAGTDLLEFSLQRTDTVKEPWRPIPYEKFNQYLRVDSLRTIITNAILKYRPSVVFTLDDVIGGYGHPEHVCVSRCILDACSSLKQNGTLPVKRVYQAVFTPTQNEHILKDNPAFIAAKEVYRVDGSPEPTTEIVIKPWSEKKMEVMEAHVSQHRNLRKIWPYYHLYPHWMYFGIFNKEYYRVMDVQ